MAYLIGTNENIDVRDRSTAVVVLLYALVLIVQAVKHFCTNVQRMCFNCFLSFRQYLLLLLIDSSVCRHCLKMHHTYKIIFNAIIITFKIYKLQCLFNR